MPSVADILSLAPGAAYLAANNNYSGTIFRGGNVNPILPRQIYAVYFILRKIYDLDPTNSALPACCNYLWELMGRWGVKAQALSGGGGSVPTPSPSNQFPIYITQANFTTATFYPNTYLIGNTIMVYLNEINRYLDPSTEFSYNGTGLTILLPGFDSTTYTYNIIIERVYT